MDDKTPRKVPRRPAPQPEAAPKDPAPLRVADVADWNGRPPRTIEEALDRLAAKVGPVG